MTRRGFSIFVSASCALALCFSLNSCKKDEDDEEIHEHGHAIGGHALVYGHVQDAGGTLLAGADCHVIYQMNPVAADEDTLLRDGNRLFPPFPNPAEDLVHLRWELGTSEHIHIAVHSAESEEETMIIEGHFAAGVHDSVFSFGQRMNGLYHFHLEIGEQELERTVLKNTPNDGRLVSCTPICTSLDDGDYACNVLVSDSVDVTSAAAQFLGRSALNSVHMICLKSGYTADPIPLTLTVEEERELNITMNP